nr:hypothetical protein Iba_chr04aCG20600 [Ipomoea batatas]
MAGILTNFHLLFTLTPSFPAMITAVAISKNNPCSTTPSKAEISLPAARESLMGVLKLTAVQSQLGFAIQFSEHLLEAEEIVFPAELDDLDGHCETRPAEPRDELRVVDDHHELVGRGLHHFLAEEGAAAALDEVQIRIDLVGAVDR